MSLELGPKGLQFGMQVLDLGGAEPFCTRMASIDSEYQYGWIESKDVDGELVAV
jgi:hypothetical protein